MPTNRSMGAMDSVFSMFPKLKQPVERVRNHVKDARNSISQAIRSSVNLIMRQVFGMHTLNYQHDFLAIRNGFSSEQIFHALLPRQTTVAIAGGHIEVAYNHYTDAANSIVELAGRSDPYLKITNTLRFLLAIGHHKKPFEALNDMNERKNNDPLFEYLKKNTGKEPEKIKTWFKEKRRDLLKAAAGYSPGNGSDSQSDLALLALAEDFIK